jgi:hypothetical protein
VHALRKIILFALLLIVPVQGMAAVLHAFTCAPQHVQTAAGTLEHVADAHPHAGHSGQEHGAAHKHDRQTDGTSSDSAQHQCCHQLSAAAAVHVIPAQADLPVFQSSLSVLELTFVPEQPQRPPRA